MVPVPPMSSSRAEAARATGGVVEDRLRQLDARGDAGGLGNAGQRGEDEVVAQRDASNLCLATPMHVPLLLRRVDALTADTDDWHAVEEGEVQPLPQRDRKLLIGELLATELRRRRRQPATSSAATGRH